jgi:3-methylfumaryl-CoA hydratase
MSPDKSGIVDVEHLRTWIGAEETVQDVLTPALAERFDATLGLPAHDYRAGEPTPRLIHFCLCQPAVPMNRLGADGHAARGGFLPPVPLPNRMWAGSQLAFVGDLIVGDAVRRVSRIANVVVKAGRTGALCFVTVDHRTTGASGGSVSERQTIVYRDAAGQAVTSPAGPAPAGAKIVLIDPAPALLFRYSALTFNGHRIHYDHPYATGVEGYPGLVVHGPLQATLLLHLAAREQGERAPDRFDFRSISPLFSDAGLCLHATTEANGAMDLWTSRPGGPVSMRAKAYWSRA